MYDCHACKRPIAPPSIVASYENKYYHPECLTCIKCNQSVSGKQFLKEKNGTLICETCNAKTAPRCHKCTQIFAPGESYKKLTDKIFYHNSCFKCCGPCQDPIAAEFYDIENGKFLCVDCYDKYGNDYEKYMNDNDQSEEESQPQFERLDDSLVSDFNNKMNMNQSRTNNTNPYSEVLPAMQRDQNPSRSSPVSSIKGKDRCEKCNEVLTGQFTIYNEKKYHSKCFTCCQCNEEFKEKTFFKLDGNALCRNCHEHNQIKNSSKCRKCTKPIIETVVTFKGGEYHDHCLVCNSCDKRLIGQSIYCDKQDNPYCVDCFTKKEAKKCGKCYQPIAPSEPNLVFEDKNFHKGCFTCQTCNRMIKSNESFYKSDDGNGIICPDCA